MNQKILHSTNGFSNCGVLLVVDDEEQNRALLRDPLEARGYEIIEAEDGCVALEKIAERAPDVILLDAMMPRMDGFEVCRRLKQNQATAAIPILMVTALSDRKERLMGVEAGANDFLNKPVDLQDLSLRVANAARMKQLFDQLEIEKQKNEQLLLSVLPKSIAGRMKNGESTIADEHPEVSILVADLVGFTRLASHISPEQIVCLLNEIFSSYDRIAEKHELEKIKTIGDAYMAASGISVGQLNHAEVLVHFALDILRETERFNRDYDTSIQIRIGIASGPVTAGVIGISRFTYDLWGETVNTAWHLQSTSKPGGVQVSERTHELVREKFKFSPQQTINIKDGAYELLGHELLSDLK